MKQIGHRLVLGLVWLVWLGCATAALAQDRAQVAVADLLAGSDAPGAAVGLLREGREDAAHGGFRISGQEVATGPDDLWHIGSNAKAMTATLVARLVEAGEVSWDDTIGEVLGEAVPGMDAGYRDATYVELLSHRARLPANIGRLLSLQLAGDLADRDVRADRLVYVKAVLAETPEDEGFLYSNAGYVVVGAMLEAETGLAWEDLIQAEVTRPLGLTTVGFGAPGAVGAADQPRGHRRGLLGGLVAVEPGPGSDNIPAMGPAGTLHLSVSDMMRFLRAHLQADPTFLSVESWERLHRPAPGADYTMGWRVEGDCLAHNGSNTLWFARMVICPAQSRAAFVVVNSGDIESQRGPMIAAVDALLAD